MAVASRAAISVTISDMGPIGLKEARAAAAVGAHGALPTRNRRGHPKDTASAVFRAANRSDWRTSCNTVNSRRSHGERRVLRFECSDTLRLAAVHEPMGAPRATPCDSGVRHWWTYPRDAAATLEGAHRPLTDRATVACDAARAKATLEGLGMSRQPGG